jgi:hypothetical protein
MKLRITKSIDAIKANTRGPSEGKPVRTKGKWFAVNPDVIVEDRGKASPSGDRRLMAHSQLGLLIVETEELKRCSEPFE